MKNFWRNNSLSIVFVLLFMVAFAGQIYTGYKEHNKERKEEGRAPMSINSYLSSGHFLQATFENWESEFLQMALFVVLTVSLRQKGSSESKKFEEEEVDQGTFSEGERCTLACLQGRHTIKNLQAFPFHCIDAAIFGFVCTSLVWESKR